MGDNRDNKPEDVLRVKRGLSDEGLYDLGTPPEPHGYVTQSMVDGVRKFQGTKGLKVDG